MGSFIDSIKDFFEELWFNIRSVLNLDAIADRVSPAFAENLKAGAAPAITLVIVLIVVSVANGARTRADSVQSQVDNYEATIDQFESVFSGDYDFTFDETASSAFTRSDLELQYSALAASSTSFSDMEETALCTEDEEAVVLMSAVSEYAEKIVDFAGKYGGVLIENTFSQLKLAAYESTSDMTAPDDGVSNILVQHLTRTIESDTYGVSDTTNTLIIMSGNDITNIKSVDVGSFMYTYLGDTDSTNRYKSTYTCVGVETGYTESFTVTSEDETSSSSTVVSTASDGTIVYSDGTIVSPDGTVTYSDGTVVSSDGTVTYPDGMVVSPDGTVSGGTVVESDDDDEEEEDEDTSSETESSSSTSSSSEEIHITIRDKSSSSSSSSSGSASSADEEDESADETDETEEPEEDEESSEEQEETEEEDETSEDYEYEYIEDEETEIDEYDFGEDSVIEQVIYTSEGELISSNTENDLVLYSVNSTTGTVRITYWDLAD